MEWKIRQEKCTLSPWIAPGPQEFWIIFNTLHTISLSCPSYASYWHIWSFCTPRFSHLPFFSNYHWHWGCGGGEMSVSTAGFSLPHSALLLYPQDPVIAFPYNFSQDKNLLAKQREQVMVVLAATLFTLWGSPGGQVWKPLVTSESCNHVHSTFR